MSNGNAKYPRVCEECGSDTWRARAFERISERNRHLESEMQKMARENGHLLWRLRDAEAMASVTHARLQRKIQRQARAIVKLTGRIRDLGQKAYAGAGHDTAPGAEYDAAGPE